MIARPAKAVSETEFGYSALFDMSVQPVRIVVGCHVLK
jgi:hypothetical protein